VRQTIAARRPALAPQRLARLGVAAAVVALALAGIALAAGLVGGGSAKDAAQWTMGQDVPTSFGAVAIDSLGRSPTRQSEMVAFAALTNLTRHPVAYSPTQFRLLAGKDQEPIAGLRMTFRPGTLQPDASFSGQLKFDAPRDGSKRWIEFREPGADRPVVIDLSRIGAMTPDSAFSQFTDR
jgi:hypothetical protein